ncbi:MAG: DMT family transporter [Candidatus Tectomicrobia bacterium]|nr:DMT family transporter [Candidatus Tectomicrobia bacterium]
MSEPQPLTPPAVGLAIFLYTLWGSMYIATKFGYRDASPLLFSGLRMIPASLTLLLLAWWNHLSLGLTRRQWRIVIAFSALFFVDTCFLYLGLNYTSVGHATILINSSVIFVMLLSRPVLGARVRLLQWIGVAGAFFGIALVMRDRGAQGSSVSLLGDLLIITAGLFWALYNVAYKRIGREVQSTVLIFYMDLLTMVPFMLAAPLVERVRFTATASLAVSVVYVAVFTHVVGFLLHNWLLRHYDASRVSAFMFIMPLAGVVLGAAVFGEQIGLWVLSGLAFVCSGIYLANRAPRRR